MNWLDRANPVVPFLAAVLYSIPMLTTIDVVSAAVALGLWIVLFLVAGLTPLTIVKRTWPLLVAAPLSGISMLLYAKPGGETHFSWWLVHVTDNSIELSIAITLRVLAVGMPALVALVGVDATRLADSLAQVVKLPSRFVLGALAGTRLFDVLGEDWRQLSAARRARGLGDTGALRRWFTMAFALLVAAIRRGSLLATAMEARAFGAGERTWARPSTLSWRDAVIVAVGVLVAAAALTVAITTGSFRLVGSE
ncbi:energy-coupling factor transporter transmembrane component T family protein [Agrococcus casei]|uniref:Transmembrane component YkoC of energizing module of thiamin-regulated ECF transporter for HydroxyMethylPyrimidine n=1 Tax=Agrococcus casei LMG 22410 TaxID=1255656 RepID=A0A1R4G6V7_9MICO|nr:energy-coupling factor transporter transmembrane component T [Agrococcus casei]SJM63911.1 Transmembrane component YkoC of energizing module of thiamin-regulated ECF transporter for HydroxyMethylPyrimidine [Agrococcus casei LMG 22410]